MKKKSRFSATQIILETLSVLAIFVIVLYLCRLAMQTRSFLIGLSAGLIMAVLNIVSKSLSYPFNERLLMGMRILPFFSLAVAIEFDYSFASTSVIKVYLLGILYCFCYLVLTISTSFAGLLLHKAGRELWEKIVTAL